ncbi:hypothetical protein PG988_002021 [Apiospora saccharicola]
MPESLTQTHARVSLTARPVLGAAAFRGTSAAQELTGLLIAPRRRVQKKGTIIDVAITQQREELVNGVMDGVRRAAPRPLNTAALGTWRGIA